MPRVSMAGEIPSECFGVVIVVFGIIIGALIANTGAVNGNPMQMAVGIIISLGCIVVGPGGSVKFKL